MDNEELEKSKLYNMKLHEDISSGNTIITRVPGGWIYRYFDVSGVHSVFVPYNTD